MTTNALLRHSAFAFGLCIAACSDSGDAKSESDAPSPESAEFEGCPDDIPTFELGMSVTSQDGSVRAKLLKAKPAPPARFFNDWTVAFSGADDAPLEGASLKSARAFMPVHGHYGKPDPTLTPHDDDPSVVDLAALNLFMRGPWEITLSVSSLSAGDADLVFHVCVEE